MRRPSGQLVKAFLVSLVIGYIISWAIMEYVLKTELRLYGVGNLSIVAILVAFLVIVVLDTPLNLKAFDWPTDDTAMDSWGHFFIVGVLIILVTVVMAGFLNSVNLLPVEASTQAIPIDWLFNLHLELIAFLFALVVVFVVYSLVAFRRRPGDTEDGAYFHGNAALEIVWTIVPLALVLYFGYLGAANLAEVTAPQPDELIVKVTAAQFSWSFEYPDLNKTSPGELVLPQGRPVLFQITSLDVIHSFWVPEFRMKQDAVPGIIRELRITPSLVGEYKVRCAELCGTGHANMRAAVRVVEPAEFDAWISGKAAPGTETNLSPAEQGAQLATNVGCAACHSIDGTVIVGPSWLGIFGSEESLTDGTTVTVDEAYLHDSIVNPNDQIVAGFAPNIMPQVFGQTLSDEQINDLIEYIKSLK